MKKDSYITQVVFRKYKNENKGCDTHEVLALFPYEVENHKGHVSYYQHTGQHGSADYKHCISITRPATLEEAKDLIVELESLGYNLKAIKKVNGNKFRQAYQTILYKQA